MTISVSEAQDLLGEVVCIKYKNNDHETVRIVGFNPTKANPKKVQSLICSTSFWRLLYPEMGFGSPETDTFPISASRIKYINSVDGMFSDA